MKRAALVLVLVLGCATPVERCALVRVQPFTDGGFTVIRQCRDTWTMEEYDASKRPVPGSFERFLNQIED